MKMPYKWLNEYVKIDVTPKEFASRMTMTGSKVEGWEQIGENIENVVVGRVLSIEKHPDADKLVVCSIDVGKAEPVQIVTGAKNLKVGDLVPAALHPAKLPGGEIKKTVMRGVESNGMLCSIAELGLTLNDCPYAIADGILVLPEEYGKPGDDIRKVLGLDDVVVEFEITPNRPDCLSMIGLAREASASFEQPLTLPNPEIKNAEGDIRDYLDVEIDASDLCPRYTAAMAKDIKIEPSPKWMREYLRDAGVRPINNIVDITNYVMLEYGQPMHAFDYSCIDEKKIIVRRSNPGEQIVTLDGQTRNLADNTLLITDPVKAIGIAGVMGGENSEITENTKMIVFESATFDGPTVRVASRKIGMRTEASGRFEKGLDCENTMPALLRACQLVEELGAGKIIGGIVDAYPVKKQQRRIKLEPERINHFIGIDVSRETMEKYLLSLGFELDGDDIIVPFWRDDVVGFADISEEIARLYGYDLIESTSFAGQITVGGLTPRQQFDRALAEGCFACGFSEAKTLTFIGPKVFDQLRIPADSVLRKAVVISNPLGEDQSLMRTTPIHSILEVMARNYNFRAPLARIFEKATIFLPHLKEDGGVDLTQLPVEKDILTMSMFGGGDFFTLKGCVNGLLDSCSVKDYEYLPCKDEPSYHPGRCAAVVTADGRRIGTVGQIHPEVAKTYGISTEVYMAELDCDLLYALSDSKKTYHALPKYPAITRDLAVLCDKGVYASQLEKAIRRGGGEQLVQVEFFDVYEGAQVAPGKKSVAFALAFRSPDHTLSDAEIDADMAAILKALLDDCGAVLRA
ncbi:MAG: phenylalanine--tRNA ligase subunit beta [Ruminococcaceae bacterium]|jgi:phenylalanyl-tRNA synthetase beta chain|nr:phenylalanine--tRNA ligase subunit beta [Oscillospiraceae bacterium]